MDAFPLENIVFLNRGDFNERSGTNFVQNLGTLRSVTPTLFACDKKYYALASIGALFAYLEQQVSISFHAKSIRFSMMPEEGPVFIGNLGSLSNL